MYLDQIDPGRVLDVGCGDGARIARLRSLGWEVCGQDVDPKAVVHARDRFGLDVHLGRLEDMPFAEQSFDCITMHHVIEHVYDPVEFLRQCRRFLKARGLLVVVTPNTDSVASRHFERFWRGLEPPRHIHLFSPKTLVAATTRAGFSVICSSTTPVNSRTFALGSLQIKNGPRSFQSFGGRLLTEVYALACFYFSIFEHLRNTESGDECVLQATYDSGTPERVLSV